MSEGIITIEQPSADAVLREVSPLVQQARAFAVVSRETCAQGLERVRALRQAEKRIEEIWEKPRKAADEAKKSLLRARDGLIAPLAEARRLYDDGCAQYEAAERQRAAEQERRLQEQARKDEENRALEAAIQAEAAGEGSQADAILGRPVEAPVVHVEPDLPKVEGVSSRTTWSAEVYDVKALVAYVHAHPEWTALLEPVLPVLNRLASAQRGALNIPGVRAVSKVVRATR